MNHGAALTTIKSLTISTISAANSGHSARTQRTGQIDPLLPFKIRRGNGSEALESGLWLKA
jgi:NaMN:DMB phosphoribosyltransferase